MRHKHIETLLQFLVAALFTVYPVFSVHAQATNTPGTDKDIMGKNRPPIDRNPPEIFETASFGLG
ncbi:MAG: hypothetical protein MI863_13990 [Desulfobacterales bacterium]|nr:hypothetical protein [Desulfobacterales bacterium]